LLKSQPFDTPWLHVDTAEYESVIAYSFREERQVLAWLAQSRYEGWGEIVDLGTFFGGSTLCLCVGLMNNQSLTQEKKIGRIHGFDVYTWAHWIRKDWVPTNVEFGTSFMNVFHNTLTKYARMVTIHPGAIEQRDWRFGPIELMIIDCAKSFDANAAVVRNFFPSLMPGSSVVHQDYAIVSRLIWIHATMEYFWDKFENEGITASGGTTLFRLREPITAVEAAECIRVTRRHCIELARRAVNRYEETDRRRVAIVKSIEAFSENPLPLPDHDNRQ
jgi:hypothetical protein